MLFTPLIHLTNGTANWILRRLGIEPAEELRSARSPQELGSLVRNSARRGSLDQDDRGISSTGRCSSAPAPPKN